MCGGHHFVAAAVSEFIVKEDQVIGVLRHEGERLLDGGALSCDLEAGHSAEEAGKPLAKEGMVVYEKDSGHAENSVLGSAY
jgi:hypothetical protein